MKKLLNSFLLKIIRFLAKVLILILFFTSFILHAQKPTAIHLSEKEGLPDKEFYDILEDSKGFIWLCADRGLFRYDGKEYKSYTNTRQRGLSTFNIQEDNLGNIWCNNISGQFFYTENNQLKLFIDLKKQLKGELASFIIKPNYLWVFTAIKIYKINIKTKVISVINDPTKRYGNPFVHNKAIFLGSDDFISKISPDNSLKKLIKINLDIKNKNGRRIVQGKSQIFKVETSLFFRQNRAGTNTFFQFDVSKKSFQTVKGLENIANNLIYETYVINNKIWFGTRTGVWVYEYIGKRFLFKKHFLKDKNVTSIIRDKDNNYWCTTLNTGIYIIPNINIEKGNISTINKNISSLDKINDSILLFGLKNGNIGFYNTHNHLPKIINLPTKDRVSNLIYHPSGNIIVSKDQSSYIINHKTLKHLKTRMFNNVKSFLNLGKGDLLYTNHIQAKSINEFAIKENKEIFKFISDEKRTYTSYYDKKTREVYISYVDGLMVYDSVWNAKRIQYKNKTIYGKSITKTANGVIWVGTFKNGIFKIKNNSVIKHYTTKNGLTSNSIQKIKADENELWIATDNSIQKFNSATLQFKKLTKKEGIPSYDISGIEFVNDKVFFSSNVGLFSLDKKKSFKTYNPDVYFNIFQINEKDTLVKSGYVLNHTQNTIKIGFNVKGFSFNQNGKYKYRLQELNNNWTTTETGISTVKYNSLPSGKYTFQVQPYIDSSQKEYAIKELEFTIKEAFWKTWWFILGVSLFVFGSIILYYKQKIRNKEKERLAQLEKINLEKELISQNLTALRSQMNPHFIFNALNSIQDLVLKQDTDTSYDYIVLFAELIRNTLNYSSQDFIPLEKEIEFLNIYLQLEKLRFGDDFNYQISSNPNEALEIPSLLIQPFIENALIHGLMHKAGKKELSVTFNFTNNVLQCVITDNGIGREKSKVINKRQGNQHESFALNSIKKRLEAFKKQYDGNIGYHIEDLYKEGTAIGTKVIVSMPFKTLF